MRKHYQRGTIYEASGSFYVRWRTPDGRKSQWLCDKDADHLSTDSPAVKDLAAVAMAEVRKKKSTDGKPTIVAYWEDTYLPFKSRHLKPSTVDGYKQIWAQRLKDHFTGRTFQDYKTVDGNKLLNRLLDEGMGKSTIQHVRSLAGNIFADACSDGVIDPPINVWRSVTMKIKPPAPPETQAYTLSETMDIINNKLVRLDAQLIVALAGLMALRPCEIVALDWKHVNFATGTLRIEQAWVRGHLGTTKTNIKETLPCLRIVMGLFHNWHQQCGEPATGWVFKGSRNGDPLNIRDYVIDVLRPAIGDGWKSLYAFRRGAASILTDLTGAARAAQQLLGHKDGAMTEKHYIKKNRASLAEGFRLLDERLALPVGDDADRL